MSRIALLSLSLLVGGCTTVRETQPAETATQQLLMSHAAEVSAHRLAAALPADRRVFVDDSFFKGPDQEYAASAIRAALLQRGDSLAPDKASSELTIEIRVGALSVDQKDKVLGVPAMTLPVPGTLTALPIPEISLYSSHTRAGKAELAAFAYDTRTGHAIAVAGPVGGEDVLNQKSFLFFFKSGRLQEQPAGMAKRPAPTRPPP